MEEIKNAIIKDTFLGIEDHGVFTFVLHLDYGGSGQGAGCYCLDTYVPSEDRRAGLGAGITAIRKILETFNLTKWEDLPETIIRVKCEENYTIKALGHVIQDQWYEFDDLRADLKEEESRVRG